jgi:ribokinase
MDLVVESNAFPRPGETLFGQHFATHPGGKGANQAVAAARLGAQVTMLGCVGNDGFGAALKAGLIAEGIDVRWLKQTDEAATGIAQITLCDAQNAIVVVPGANALLLPADLDAAEAAFADCDVVLTQLEVPLATVEHAALLAARHGKPLILNPAPATPLAAELLQCVALLTPNEFELGITLRAADADWETLVAQMPARVVMTKGEDGAWFSDGQGQLQHQPGFKVEAVDTTGAGDTFNGALAAFWPLGLAEAVWRASAAGALSVTKAGAQGGMPDLATLEHFLRTHLQHAVGLAATH